MAKAILLYDGECGYCDRTVQKVLRRDRHARIQFAPLQSNFAKEALARHGLENLDLSTMVLILDPETPTERLLLRSRAAFTVCAIPGGLWSIPGVLRFLPAWLFDWGYNLIARNRFRLGGRLDSCRLPTPEHRARFLDMP